MPLSVVGNSKPFKLRMPSYWNESRKGSQTTITKKWSKNGRSKNRSLRISPSTPSSSVLQSKVTREELCRPSNQIPITISIEATPSIQILRWWGLVILMENPLLLLSNLTNKPCASQDREERPRKRKLYRSRESRLWLLLSNSVREKYKSSSIVFLMTFKRIFSTSLVTSRTKVLSLLTKIMSQKLQGYQKNLSLSLDAFSVILHNINFWVHTRYL